jgi:Helix-turn-helix domain
MDTTTNDRALWLDEFCKAYKCSRADAYKQIDAGLLIARKRGTRTIILKEDADAWLRALPVMPARGAGKAA